ncbi:MAG TPA: phosphodiester glycosidase family protein [Dehalococcoidia bacterium]|nr:phosphodiester glycosidase family protein [Dehalococcoidia bacterium]
MRVRRRSKAWWLLPPAILTLVGLAAYLLAYPAVFPVELEAPVVVIDPGEQKTTLESPLTIEVRGSLGEADVRESLAITPAIDLEGARIEVENIAELPFHSELPWAKTRVTIVPAEGRLWEPETAYSVSLREEEFEFETITLPRVVSVLADEGEWDFEEMPTNRGVVIRFNEPVAWDDKYLSVEPAATLEVVPSGEGDEVLVRPAERWENYVTYEVSVLEGLPDEFGHGTDEDYAFSFTTWPPPRLLRTAPEGTSLPPDVAVEVTFERPADRASVEAAFTIDPPAAGAFEWASDTEMTWRPEGLPYSETLTVGVGGSAVGGDLFESRTWSFETHDPPVFVEIRGSGTSPSIIEAVPSGGLGEYSLQWISGDTAARILAASPYGETRRFEVTVTSGDQTAAAGIDLQGHPWPDFTPQPCPAGWYMAEISVCVKRDELAGPTRTYVARVDMRDPSLNFDVLPTAGRVGSKGKASARAYAAGSIVAVNGDMMHDLADGTYTLGPVISSGGYAYASTSYGAYFALDWGRGASVGTGIDVRPTVSGNAGTWSIDAVNAAPADGQIALFNGYRTAPIGPFEGCWVPVTPYGGDMVDEAWEIWCGTIRDVRVPPGGFALIGRGSGASWLTASVPGVISLSTPGYSMVVGGSHVLQPYVAAGYGYKAVEGRHPRTAIGTDDAGFLYLVTVDGRSGASVGMTIGELSGYLGGLGITKAINLDGGGSSTFMVHSLIWNSPSDGQERDVASMISVSQRPQRGCWHPLVHC